MIGILSGFVNRMAWSGTLGYSVSARNAHEQKMAGVLGTWRSGFESMMFLLLAVVGLTYLNSEKFQTGPNGGARLTSEGSSSLEDLRALEAAGVEILTCGTCLNFYGLSDRLAVGAVTNMYTIVEKLSAAEKIIRP